MISRQATIMYGYTNDGAALICVVDDDSSIRHAMSNLLEAGGYMPVCFDRAESLLTWSHLNDIDLALIDVDVNGMNGLAVQALLASRVPSLPSLFIGGRFDDDMKRQAVQAGALALLSKPVDPNVLFRHIERALARRPV